MPLNAHNRRQIALLAGEDLSPADASAAERAVHSCPDCRGHFESVREGLSALGDSAADAHPGTPSLWPQMRDRLAVVSPAAPPSRMNGWIPAFAVTAAALLVGLFAYAPQWGQVAGGGYADPGRAAVYPAGDQVRPESRVEPPRMLDPWPRTGFAEDIARGTVEPTAPPYGR